MKIISSEIKITKPGFFRKYYSCKISLTAKRVETEADFKILHEILDKAEAVCKTESKE
jgi:hypothetical protein